MGKHLSGIHATPCRSLICHEPSNARDCLIERGPIEDIREPVGWWRDGCQFVDALILSGETNYWLGVYGLRRTYAAQHSF